MKIENSQIWSEECKTFEFETEEDYQQQKAEDFKHFMMHIVLATVAQLEQIIGKEALKYTGVDVRPKDEDYVDPDLQIKKAPTLDILKQHIEFDK